MNTSGATPLPGGSFLINDLGPMEVFTPEDFSDEQKMIAETTLTFIAQELMPRLEAFEHQEEGLSPMLLRKAGELGLLSVDVPEHFGGMGLDKVSSLLFSENIAGVASFATAVGAHASIGTLPLVFFGSDALKTRYLPRMATAELICAYALTEPNAGSDALAGKTNAVTSADGQSYTLTGTKMWITNAGFADLFTVFARVDGDRNKFTAFLVERGWPGVSVGAEERKMGIKGSSTRVLNLDSVVVPASNIIGEVGQGAKIALNILNIGRFKLGASTCGGSKVGIRAAAKYANERIAFGAPIASFGLVQQMLADMAVSIYVQESMIYRTAGMLDASLSEVDPADGATILKRIEEYSVECSINKVFCSENCDRDADRCVQIHGGYGYSAEYPAERFYRDARINRIFEGTNEINRMVIVGQLVRRAMKGALPLMGAAQEVTVEVLGEQEVGGYPVLEGAEGVFISRMKKLALFTAGAAIQKYMNTLADQQMVMGCLADIIIETYAAESALLRTMKRMFAGSSGDLELDLTRVFLNESLERVASSARQVFTTLAQDAALKAQLQAVDRLTRHLPINSIAARERIAKRVSEAGEYPLNY